MENKQIRFNDLTREFIEDFISKMDKEEKQKLKEFIEDNPKENSSAMFVMVKSYIYNHFFRSIPVKNKKGTFMDTINSLLDN